MYCEKRTGNEHDVRWGPREDMEVIITHDVVDFDALASAVAAQKLYPGAQIVLGARYGRDVRAYMALHRDRFPILAAAQLEAALVRRAILVDVRRKGRLGHVPGLRDRILAADPQLEVHVWDHHAATDDDVPAALDRSEPVGSATTLLVEELTRRGLPLDELEATLFALGIHVDTGSLRYASTSARDAASLAWLLDRGARLSVINRYIDRPFSSQQLQALRAILEQLRIERIGSMRIGIATFGTGSAVNGLDEVLSEALALEDVHAVLACYELRAERVQIIARARASWIDVAALLRPLGGGGHAAAAAAIVQGQDAAQCVQQLLAALRASPPRAARVRDLMTSPVHTIAPETSIADVAAVLGRFRHTGAPVVAAGKLIGILSQRDIEAAIAKGGAQAKASHYMSQPVHTTSEDVLIEEALEAMVSANVGRLPVLRQERLVGIITRRDILAALYG